MPTHFVFSFGVGDYFRFKFDYGKKPSSVPFDPKSAITAWEMAKKSGVRVDSKQSPVTPKAQLDCPLFTAIPAEIRHMIYRRLLMIPDPIEKAHKHLGSKDTALLDNYNPIPHIDAAILRTCRLVYSEALPILYGQNTFEFSSANSIRSFQSKSLIGYPLAFNFTLAPMGRLTWLRSVVLNMNAETSAQEHMLISQQQATMLTPYYVKEYRWHSPIGLNGQRGAPNRDHIWRDWSTTLFCENDELCPWGSRNGLGFPSLERLTLDFSEWQLTDSEGLLVNPFLKKLGESGGLQELVLKGVKHRSTQEQFRIGLVNQGGTFRVVNQ